MRIATLGNASVGHTVNWVSWFRAQGHEVRLFSLEPAPAGFPDVTLLPAASLPGVLRYPLAVPRLRRELAAFAPDLVDAHYVPNYGFMAALAGRHPLSIAAWGSDLLLAAHAGPLQRARAAFALERADLVICDADNLAAAARRVGARADTVLACPWGIDRARFVPAATRTPGLIVSTRMHEDVYDLPTVIEAVGRVLDERPHATFVAVGDGSRRAALERLAAERLPAGRWRFTGRIAPAEMAALLARAEVAISASRSDSTSQSLLESMACGAVPVVSDLEGNREWVADGDGARLFAVGDVAGAAAALRHVLDDAAWAATARARNAAVVAARGDAARNMARIAEAFARLVADHGRRGGRTA